MSHKAVCVIGYPAKHSRSPLIHNYWVKQHGIDAEYRIEEVPPEGFPALIRSLPERGYIGANVTVPHKQAALAMSEPDARRRCGQYTLVCRRRAALHQYGRRGLSRQSRCLHAWLGPRA
jgi:shikimate 5-dehydrogenase